MEALWNGKLLRLFRDRGEVIVVDASADGADPYGNLGTPELIVDGGDKARRFGGSIRRRDGEEFGNAAILENVKEGERENVVDIAADIRVEDHFDRLRRRISDVEQIPFRSGEGRAGHERQRHDRQFQSTRQIKNKSVPPSIASRFTRITHDYLCLSFIKKRVFKARRTKPGRLS